MKYLLNLFVIASLLLSSFAFAIGKPNTNSNAKDDFFTDNSSFQQEAEVFFDPLERFNRQSFKMFKIGTIWMVIPAAKAYDYSVPDFLQPHIFTIFANMNTVFNAANGILIPQKAISIKYISHFLTNTLFGFAGFFDVHSAYVQPMPSFVLEDIAQYYFEKPLPYLVLPIGFGNVFSVVSWLERRQIYLSIDGNTFQNINLGNVMLGYMFGGIVISGNKNKEQIEDTLKHSIDAYSVLRNIYYQSQSGKLQYFERKEEAPYYKTLISSEFI